MLIGGSRREQVLFAGVMKELLAPINNPRYVIIGKEWGVRAYCVSFPCPSVFARRQQDAEILRRQLDRCLTHCTMVYTRTEEGRHPDVYLEVQHPCWSCNSNSSSANASAGVR